MKMKCELCKHEAARGASLCPDCGEMIQRLVFVQQRIEHNETAEVRKQATAAASAGAH
jgi:hypothetical protein